MSNILWWHSISGFIAADTAPPPQSGTLTVNVSISGNNRLFVASVTDSNGIRIVTSATVIARDGTSRSITFNRPRGSRNTLTYSGSRMNARWNSGTMTVSYLDLQGNMFTLTETWSV